MGISLIHPVPEPAPPTETKLEDRPLEEWRGCDLEPMAASDLRVQLMLDCFELSHESTTDAFGDLFFDFDHFRRTGSRRARRHVLDAWSTYLGLSPLPTGSKIMFTPRTSYWLFRNGLDLAEATLKRAAILYDVLVIERGALYRHGLDWRASFDPLAETLAQLGVDWIHTVDPPEDFGAWQILRGRAGALLYGAAGPTHIARYFLFNSDHAWAKNVYAADTVTATWMDCALFAYEAFDLTVSELSKVPAASLDSAALDVFVPGLDRLQWEAIAEFREHPASREAREKLREFDRQSELAAPGVVDKRLAEAIAGDVFAAVAEHQPHLKREMGMQALGSGVGFIPVIGPALSSAIGIGERAATAFAHRSSWRTALGRLRDR